MLESCRTGSLHEEMPDTNPCLECISLVGADRARQPHHELDLLPGQSDPDERFRCKACDSLWSLGRFGWSRESGRSL